LAKISRHFITAQCYACAVYAVIVRPSICSSVCPSQVGSSTKMVKHNVTQTMPYDSPGTLVATNRCGKNSDQQFSTNISLYLRNGARYRHSYYEMLIGTHISSRLVLFPVTLNDPNYPKPPYFRHFAESLFRIFSSSDELCTTTCSRDLQQTHSSR